MGTLARTALLAGALLGCAAGSSGRVTPAQADARVKAGQALLVDVREADEISSGMAEPALWYATSAIERDPAAFAQFLRERAPGKELIFYCTAGGRAGRAAERARSLGYHAANMGGFSDWSSAGLPVIRR